ncbi:hypothetical protein HDU84_009771 [Entophlyctis sp. JEL0112]|nr:hypothetical protein HDU84_009771 [Entophlyctis sp. JEL0112]
MGEGLLANELLPTTKGHALGFGFVCLGFGMSFTVAIQMFGYASAHLNPAMCLALWIRDKLSFTDFLALSVSEMAGGFCAGVFVYLMYMPHFKTLPEAQGSQEENLLRTRDQLDPQALRLASYSTKPNYSRPATTEKPATFTQRLAEIKYYLLNQTPNTDEVLDHLIGGTYALHGSEVPFPTGTESVSGDAEIALPRISQDAKALKRRHSLQVADMQRLLRKMEKELAGSAPYDDAATNVAMDSSQASGSASGVVVVPKVQKKITREEALGRAAILADQASKLSVFATRPAIYLPLHNVFVETMCTFFLIFGASLIDNRFDMISNEANAQAGNIDIGAFLVGMMIMALILGFGGPTGYAANPARDMAPRLAHFVLPIPGKGSSELVYGVLIAVGALIGGAIAGGLILAVENIPVQA